MICRLCLKEKSDVIAIFDVSGIDMNVAELLGKYFWFKPKIDDPISTSVCTHCWLKVSDFDEFYFSVEEAHRLLTERFSFHSSKSTKCLTKDAIQDNLDTKESDTVFEISLLSQDAENKVSPLLTDLQNEVDVLKPIDNLQAIREEECFEDEVFLLDNTEEVSIEDTINNDIQEVKLRRSRRTVTNGKVTEAKTKPIPEKRKGTAAKINLTAETKSEKKVFKNSNNESKFGKNSEIFQAKEDVEECKMQEADKKIRNHMELRCDVCNLIQMNFLELRRHMERVHNQKGYATCCNKKFYKRILLVEHIEKHLNPDCYKCDECYKVFADKQCMRNHFLLKHQPDELKTFGCDKCSKKFAKPYLLEQHKAIHEERNHLCNICQKGFPRRSLLSSHIVIVHKNYGTMCEICAKVIRGRAAFNRHMLMHQGVSIPEVQCHICGSWHKNRYSLQKHRQRHNEDGIDHVCSKCGKVSPNRSALLSHYRYKHGTARTHECGVCKKTFKKPINLKEHMAQHTGEVLYTCPHCPKTFNSNANMHSHRKKKHPKEFEERRRQRMKSSLKSSILKEAMNSPSDIPRIITIKTQDDGETHNILVTTEDQTNSN